MNKRVINKVKSHPRRKLLLMSMLLYAYIMVCTIILDAIFPEVNAIKYTSLILQFSVSIVYVIAFTRVTNHDQKEIEKELGINKKGEC